MKCYEIPELKICRLADMDVLTASGLSFEQNGYGDEIDFEDFLS